MENSYLPELERQLRQLNLEVGEERQRLSAAFQQIHQMVAQRESELMARLDAIPAGISTRIEERRATLEQLTQTRENMERKLQANPLNESVQTELFSINSDIANILSERILFPRVSLQCDTDSIQKVLEDKCLVHSTLSHYTSTQPVWHTVRNGEGRGQLCRPSALSIDENTQLIYVGENSISQRIQIFTSEGEHHSTIHNEELMYCHSMKIHGEHIYVSTGMLGISYLLKLNKAGKTVESVKTDDDVFGLYIEGGTLYTCISKSLVINVYDLNLDPHPSKEIQLKARYFDIHTTPRDLIVYKQRIFVLFTFYSVKHYHLGPIQIFQLDGSLMRCLAIGNLIKYALYFFMDSQQNILVSDFSGHCIRIFSPDGLLVRTIGRMGREEAGELYNPTGVVVDCRGRIITVDRKRDSLLQAFLFQSN